MRVARLFVTATLTAIDFPAIAAADLLLDGDEFQINTYTTYAQGDAAVSVAANGTFVVAWTSFNGGAYGYPPEGQDGSGHGVFGQRYDSAGAAAGTEFRVNSSTTSNQSNAAVAAADDGSFVVVWQTDAQDGYNFVSIFGRRYDNAGAAVGAEFQVNAYTSGSQFYPAIAGATGGSFVVVWDSIEQDGHESGVFGQRYDNAGTAVGTEFQVNSHTVGSQSDPVIAAAADGSFVVAWSSLAAQDGSDSGVFGQRYDNAGAAIGSEFQINSYTTGSQSDPAIAVAADGSFVVVWTSRDINPNIGSQDGDAAGVFGQRYDRVGAPAGTEFQVNLHTTSYQGHPAIAVAADGSFVVAWTSRDTNSNISQDGDDAGVFGRRYDGSGAAVGTEFQINSHTEDPQFVSAVSAIDGGFVVVWSSGSFFTGSPAQDGNRAGVFGQLLCIDDNANAICDSQETARTCGDTADGEGITTTDALFVLQAGVGLSACLPCVGDADGSGSIAASDALRLLFASVGQNVELLCPPCA